MVMRGRRCLCLVKGEQRFVFTYHTGQEPVVVARLLELASDPRSGLDWFDAATLSCQLGRDLRESACTPLS